MLDQDTRHAVNAEMVEMSERLVAEYAAIIPADAVVKCISRCREDLLRSGVRHGLPAATEGAVRVRLGARVPAHLGA